MNSLHAYEERVTGILRELGIETNWSLNHTLCPEATDLISVGLDIYGREQKLTRNAANAWGALKVAAQQDRVILLLVSAFRSFDYQKNIFQRKLNAGLTMEHILQVNAAPGFSEHHTGRTVDLAAPDCPPLTEAFEQTPAFAWLVRRAHEFHFHMTYPRGNTRGIIYEPWHWTFQEPTE